MASDATTVPGIPGYPDDLAAALWMLQDARDRTLDALDGLADEEVDAVPPGAPNAIGSLLYHVAAIEADWLYADILVVDYPDWMSEVFPFDVRDEGGVLTGVPGLTVAAHLERLASVRAHFLADIARLGDGDYRRERRSGNGVATPEWVLHHLRQHEAEHRGQIQSIRTALRSAG